MSDLMKSITLFIFLLIGAFVNGQVYNTKKKFEFDIKYFQSQNNLSTQETISLTMTGRKWKRDESQFEGIWTYFTKPKTKRKFQNQKTIGWTKVDTTGIIENEFGVWLHPPRHNQYCLTELAPFPNFRKNLNVGDAYQIVLSIGSGWGEWDGKNIESSYVIKDFKQQANDTVWTVEASSQFEAKSNNCIFIFSDRKGFILLDCNFYNGDKLTIKLRN